MQYAQLRRMLLPQDLLGMEAWRAEDDTDIESPRKPNKTD